MRAPPFEEFEHDADIGLRVRGTTMKDLFENAAQGMIELMLDPASVQPQREVELLAIGDDDEMLLVAWLSEILFAFDADRFAPCTAVVDSIENGKVRGRLRGEPFQESRHRVRHLIKAVTYHNLKVEQTGGGCRVGVIFDV